MQRAALGSQPPVRAPIQRQFVRVTPGAEDVLVDPRDVVTCLEQAGYDPTNGMSLPNLVKKLAEGPDICFQDDGALPAAIEARLAGRARATLASGKLAGGGAFRKTYRLFGRILPLRPALAGLRHETSRHLRAAPFDRMDEAADLLVQEMPALLHHVDPAVRAQKAEAILRSCHDLLAVLASLLADYPATEDFRTFWACFHVVSAFGPLGHAINDDAGLSGAAPRDSAERDALLRLEEEIHHDLREIRLGLARRPTIAVIAHRGAGPTNRNMGGLIRQEDARRTRRLAENSPEAFDHALGVTEDALRRGRPSLDGIECDVFLALDGIPVVTHEGDWYEQLSSAQQGIAPALPHGVRDVTAEDLTRITRTGAAGSRFMTLAELLEMIRPIATAYFTAAGRAFRVEIEMKGTGQEDGGGAVARRPGALRDATAKVISHAVKAGPPVPVEYVLFNGTEADIPGFARLRRSKTALGGLFTAFGGGSALPAALDLGDVDELRYGFNRDPRADGGAPAGRGRGRGPMGRGGRDGHAGGPGPVDLGPALPLTEANLRNFIVTLVFAQEFAPADLRGRPHVVEPSHDIEARHPSRAVSADVERLGAGHPTSSDWSRAELSELLRRLPRDLRLHLLTDYPEVAEWLKT